ncbi:MAG: UbiD family decarboxylase [Candidatus Tectomicrobia bacterium]|nr:UbiD family decarboxylase [Candidatus Tectomicrobia bacterium]
MEQDLRAAMKKFEAAGELLQVRKEVDPDYELSAVLWRAKRGPAVLFEKVKGSKMRVIGNVNNTRGKFAISLDLPRSEILPRLVHGMEKPVKVEVVSNAPCQQVVIERDIDLAKLLPAPRVSEKDAGPYLTAGILIAKHPETGLRNCSIHRMQVHGPDTLGVNMAPTHLSKMYQRAGELNEPLQVAVCIGNHPAVMLASNMYGRLGSDELEMAGALFGKPLQVAKCRTINMEAPAGCEIVLEGEMRPGELKEEGPFGELMGSYAFRGKRQVFHCKAVTMREDAIYHHVVGSNHPEHLLIMAMPREANIYKSAKVTFPRLEDINMTEGGCGLFHAVVSIRKTGEGEGKKAILTLLTLNDLLKQVTVVDSDIDVHDPVMVEWAIATRVRAEKDVVLFPDLKTNKLDRLANKDGTITKWGIDATRPLDLPAEVYEYATVPAEIMKKVERDWEQYLS